MTCRMHVTLDRAILQAWRRICHFVYLIVDDNRLNLVNQLVLTSPICLWVSVTNYATRGVYALID